LKIDFCGGETWTLRKVDQKYLEGFEILSSRRIEKIKWTDHVRNEVLQIAKEERNILHTTKRRKANLIGHMLCGNCGIKRVTEGKIEGRT
jgi:formate dehydrogenase assembly factor FdhD